MIRHRDVDAPTIPWPTSSPAGRHIVAVIGVDRYRNWSTLSNAVSDAAAARSLFMRLGFEEVTKPLFDEQATGEALMALVTDELVTLGENDSLVLFFAGHGGTRTQQLGAEQIKTGYLIPVDAMMAPNRVTSWIQLDTWLHRVALLPPRHILVLIDACHSGIALGPVTKWRDIGASQNAPFAALSARRSRRIITSALDDQRALDNGPVHGHSLFMGCLIEGLTDGLVRDGRRFTTGSELGLYVQRRVEAYPMSRHTPDFGAFDFDDRGEMLIPLSCQKKAESPPVATPPSTPVPLTATVRSSMQREAAPRDRRRRAAFAVASALAALAVVLAYARSNDSGALRHDRPTVVVERTSDATSPRLPGFRIPSDRMMLVASSFLKDWKQYTFTPGNLIDDDLSTSWQPERRSAGGVGEWFKITLNPAQTVTGFEVFNGFRRSDELGDLYRMNNRIADATVEFSDGSTLPLHLDDMPAATTIVLGAGKPCKWFKVTVDSVYRGSKWNDLAVSEFHVFGMEP